MDIKFAKTMEGCVTKIIQKETCHYLSLYIQKENEELH